METTAMVDFVPMMHEIKADYEEGAVKDLTMHDGSVIRLHKLEEDWDPLDRNSALSAVRTARDKNEILTGLLYIDPDSSDLHTLLNTPAKPLNSLTQAELTPGQDVLAAINQGAR